MLLNPNNSPVWQLQHFSSGWRNLHLPEVLKIVRLSQRQRQSQTSLEGLRSIKDRLTCARLSSELCRDGSFQSPSPFSESTTIVSPVWSPVLVSPSLVIVEVNVGRCFNRAFRAFWYRRLRSLRYVSQKRRKERQLIPAKIVRNQNIARQPKAVVNAPPRMGPSD